MPRQPDRVTLESEDGREFDKWSRLSVTNDITSPTEATFSVGGPEFNELRDMLAIGDEFTVRLNGKPRMKGRVEVQMVPGSATAGTSVDITVRTKVADARYASADPDVRVEGASIKDFVLACYEPLGYVEADFIFAPFVARNLITGEAKGATPAEDFETIKVDQAKVNPPETIHNAVERHLKRYGATQWDGPDGRVIIGRPDDAQLPLYRLLCKIGSLSQGNNLISYRKILDFSEVPREINVFGSSPGKGAKKSSIKGVAIDDDVELIAFGTDGGHFNRRVIMISQQAKDQATADRIALREMSARIRRKDAFEVTVDGWSYWNGDKQIPWANNTTADVDIDDVGGTQGRYLIVRVELQQSTQGGTTTRLQMVAPGIWVI